MLRFCVHRHRGTKRIVQTKKMCIRRNTPCETCKRIAWHACSKTRIIGRLLEQRKSLTGHCAIRVSLSPQSISNTCPRISHRQNRGSWMKTVNAGNADDLPRQRSFSHMKALQTGSSILQIAGKRVRIKFRADWTLVKDSEMQSIF